MSELTDDQLDGLFRKSAEEFDPPFDPAAWQDMKTRLDTHDRITPGGAPIWKNLLRWGIIGVVLLLLLGGVWFSYQQASRSDTGRKLVPVGSNPQSPALTTVQRKRTVVARQDNTEPMQKTSADSPADGPAKGNQPVVSAETNVERDASDTPDRHPDRAIEEVTGTKMPNADKPADAKLSVGGVVGEVKIERSPSVRSGTATPTAVRRAGTPVLTGTEQKNGSRLSTRKQIETGRNRRETTHSDMKYSVPAALLFNKQPVQTRLESGRVADARTSGNVITPEPEKTESVSIPTLSELAIRPARWSPALAFKGRDVIAQPDTTAHKSVPKPDAMRGLSVRLAVAPDLSSIGLKNFTRPGTNVGILLEYRLASRWSVQAGVIQSTKIYTARTTQYELPYPIMKQTVKPESVNGECRMFDIPINLRYDVVVRPRLDGRPPSRWFVSGGVTSYIIKKEDYVYNYPPHTYNVIPGWSGEGTGGFGFSQLNLSAGYERALSKRLSWQVEPFIKAPLRGVGYLKINLLSTGAFFSIRYKL